MGGTCMHHCLEEETTHYRGLCLETIQEELNHGEGEGSSHKIVS